MHKDYAPQVSMVNSICTIPEVTGDLLRSNSEHRTDSNVEIMGVDNGLKNDPSHARKTNCPETNVIPGGLMTYHGYQEGESFGMVSQLSSLSDCRKNIGIMRNECFSHLGIANK